MRTACATCLEDMDIKYLHQLPYGWFECDKCKTHREKVNWVRK